MAKQKPMVTHRKAAVFAWYVFFGGVAFSEAQPTAVQTSGASREASLSGVDIILPNRRADLLVEVEEGDDERSVKTTLRYTHPIPLRNQRRLDFRIDVPFVHEREELKGDEGFRTTKDHRAIGDVLMQASLVKLLGEDRGFGLGTQLIVPTSIERSKRQGRWRLRPSVGYRWPVRSISDSAFFQLVARYDFSLGSRHDPDRVREFQLAPTLEIELQKGFYVSIFPSTDIRYNFVDHELFVPANFEIGKSWGRLVTSLEGGIGIIKGENPAYDWKFEGRLGFRF